MVPIPFKGGFIEHWILGSVNKLVLIRFLPEAMLVIYIRETMYSLQNFLGRGYAGGL